MDSTTQAAFAGRAAIVTGAGSGIGRATAVALAREGAHVLGVGRRRDALEETAAAHEGIEILDIDICRDDAPAKVVETAVERWGRLDLLVNNAGATAVMPLAEVEKQAITELFALNVIAPSMLAHEALPHLRRTSGTIINLSSTYGHRPMSGGAHYSATKAAIEQMTRSWALELAGEGVRVNSVAPGPTRTDVMIHAGLTPEAANEMYAYERDRIPTHRIADVKDVAHWILRMAEPAGRQVTGQVITVDGGLELI
ncbi:MULTISPECIES: SDR family NAD(P)-dependent oxidoreductase [Streptomyces]|uniref:SDR family NAD(P)-dependent oxidoreductase n=1 Tax=Streptomyces cadmiisoli TaxID=2184053 RepID=A0A2Z4IT20_9ACTN|nr:MULTISPECIES: SDR family oxidoreductase [Streptomyces]AWW35907.1 SDR family NAD(P)-dependent oxidoreductase [Streptomyces cadmiisoli]KOV69886.1 ketoreductase [Streptomyces sp. AS58]